MRDHMEERLEPTAEEKHRLLHDFNDTWVDYPADSTIHRLFEEQAAAYPDDIALMMGESCLTYRQLSGLTNQLGHYLRGACGISAGDMVGIYMERCMDQLIAILGILKAGGAYVPIDERLPEQRIRTILDDSGARVLISRKKHIRMLNRLQWSCKDLKVFLCIDSSSVYSEREMELNPLMDENVWDYVGETAVDDVTCGGWISSYTGLPLAKEEMDEYGDNALQKLLPVVNKKSRVLEIGCASGISMYRIAPHVGLYYGTDLSAVTIEKNRERVAREGYANIRLGAFGADQIDAIGEKDFDLIVINSVVQIFHGLNHLRQIIGKCITLLAENGYLFIGDVMDQDLKEQLLQSLEAYKEKNKGAASYTKTDFSDELFVSRDFFRDLQVDIPSIRETVITDKIYTISNELTGYRYDVLIRVDRSQSMESGSSMRPEAEMDDLHRKKKYQHDRSVLERYGMGDLEDKSVSSDLAYLMYTSGSTGIPKGVMIEHRNVVRLVRPCTYAGLTGKAVLLSTGAFSFDATTFEYWAMLLNGGKLILCSQDGLLDDRVLAGLIKERGVDTMWFTAGWLHQLIDRDIGIFVGLATLLAGGDRLSPVHVNALRRRYPSMRIINGYGPTENTTFSLTYTIDAEMESIPIGKPIDNSTAYILDAQLRLCPVGIAGEICLGGAGLARGYLNDPQLTAAKFIRHPFKEGQRLYRTGDWGRWLSDGNIEFLGRMDGQVKIRGYRIELGEIETIVSRYPAGIRQVVVEGREVNNEKVLVAFYVAGTDIDKGDLRAWLQRELPEYMVPAFYVKLDSLPLTTNGKVDRKALDFVPEDGLIKKTYVPPGSELGEKLTGIWQEIMGLKKIGVTDNFFELGGHSLLATKILFSIKMTLNIVLPRTSIFNYPSIQELESYIQCTQTIDTDVSYEALDI